jgi:hypothetical protein
LFVNKSLVVDYQRVTNSLIFAIFATTGNFVSVEATQQRYRMLKPNKIYVIVAITQAYLFGFEIRNKVNRHNNYDGKLTVYELLLLPLYTRNNY